jgi:hypothetical protein
VERLAVRLMPHDDRYTCPGQCSECAALDTAVHYPASRADAALDAMLDDLDRVNVLDLARHAYTLAGREEAQLDEIAGESDLDAARTEPRARRWGIWARGITAGAADTLMLAGGWLLWHTLMLHNPLLAALACITTCTAVTSCSATIRKMTGRC